MHDAGIVMGDEGIKRTVIGPLGLLAVGQRAPVGQSMSYGKGRHAQKNQDEKDCWNKDQ